MRRLVVVALALLPSAAFAQMPQQHPTEPVTEAQLYRQQRDALQQQLADAQVAMFLAHQQLNADEAQKTTLLDWLKIAQEAAKPQ